MCERMFSGRQIGIARDQRGRYILKCPTPDCPSGVAHWFYLGGSAGAAACATRDGETRYEYASGSDSNRPRRQGFADISFAMPE